MEPTNKDKDGSIYAGMDESDFFDGGRYAKLCKRLFSEVKKNEDVSPYFVIICGQCGREIEKDLYCPRCKHDVKGELMHNICEFCMNVVTYCHTPESCQDKDAPFATARRRPVTDEDIARVNSPSWEPTSP